MEKMHFNDYIGRIENEYNSATHQSDDLGFTEWLHRKKDNLKLYNKFLIEMGLNQNQQLIELDKGFFDTVALANKNQQIIEISNCSKMDYFTNVEHLYGRLGVQDGNLFVANSIDKNRHDLREQQYVTQFPMDEQTKKILRYLACLKEQIYVGVYGNIYDHNRSVLLRSLKKMVDDLNLSGIDFEFEETSLGDKYAYVLKNNNKTLKRSIKK